MHPYLREIRTCWRLGHRWRDRFRLVAAGLEFHLSNFFHLPPDGKATSYSIRLDGVRTIYLRRRSGDFFVFHEIFTSRCYELPQQLAPQGSGAIVDLGANIGLTTLFLASRFPGATHVCVEPNPANVMLLRKNLSFLRERLQILEAAVADQTGEAGFADSPWSWGGHLIQGALPTRLVSCLTVDQIISSRGLSAISILKVDIEGAEKRIFSAKPSWLQIVGCIVIELHGGYSAKDFELDVASSGFEVLLPGSAFGNSMIVAVPATDKSLGNSDLADHPCTASSTFSTRTLPAILP
jgi:FkbM family methyltransferase